MQKDTYSYDATSIEKYWQKKWNVDKKFKLDNLSKKEKYYVLEMFPYPSGRIHMGHVRVYTLGDVLARFKRAQGYNVLHPMGWDAFGMPAENAALENKIHPGEWTNKNIKNMREQLMSMGISYDWEKELSTCSKNYIEQQQKLFIELYKSGLLYKKKAWANWDPVEKTVLANEQVINGKGWRSGAIVEKKLLNQWFLSITSFAEELLNDLNALNNWPENVKVMQRNWIGKSTGLQLKFFIKKDKKIRLSEKSIEVFSTRPDTIFGASFLALAPDHRISQYLSKENNNIKKFIINWQKSAADEETLEKGPKNGIFTGLYVSHPFTDKRIPVYIANFVLSSYGTGAIFGVPAHDPRDFEFAKKYKLEILYVVKPKKELKINHDVAYTEDGIIYNSDFLNGLNVEMAKQLVTEKIEKLNLGKGVVKYRLRDWCASRQRYWGCPIPVIYREDGEVIPVEETELPIELPKDIDFSKKGNPLDNHPTWKYTKCKKTGMTAIRETDTLDTFFDSSWYFLRFIDPSYKKPFNQMEVDKWCPVHQYVGGIEHAVLHLLYARFFVKALHRIGYANIKEPFDGLFCQGMVCHKTYKDTNNNWVYPDELIEKNSSLFHKDSGLKVTEYRSEKMSKSKKNIIDPVNILREYGADTARLFMLSDSPPERKLEWTNNGIEASKKYLSKVWNFFSNYDFSKLPHQKNLEFTNENAKILQKRTHYHIEKTTSSLERFQYNVAVASLREWSNLFLGKVPDEEPKDMQISLVSSMTQWTIMLSPMLPHLAEELWKILGNKDYVCDQKWPVANKTYLVQERTTLVIQINGKKKVTLKVEKGLNKKQTEKMVLSSKNVNVFLTGLKIKRTIIIPDRIVNFVI